jgi:assimilatory nitrate reductase catalytic subunit
LLKDISRNQPCDITGIQDYRMLDEQGGVQWPFPEGINRSEEQPDQKKKGESLSKERRLFEDGKFFTEDGRARFLFSLPGEMPEKPDDEYPFLLLTGRGTSLQWHTNTRTEKSDVLRKLYPKQCYVEINPKDAERLGIRANDVVSIVSRRAEITATAFITPTVQPGQIFVPMHYAEVNKLTFPAFDQHSRHHPIRPAPYVSRG